jgi:hypothetical protein
MFVPLRVGDIQRAAVQRHQTPTAVPRTQTRSGGDRPDHDLVQRTKGLPPQSSPALCDGRVAAEPLDLFAVPRTPIEQNSAKNRSAPFTRVQPQRDDVVHQIERRQLPPALSFAATRAENRLDLVLQEELTQ